MRSWKVAHDACERGENSSDPINRAAGKGCTIVVERM
jgi:hypothetical protein